MLKTKKQLAEENKQLKSALEALRNDYRNAIVRELNLVAKVKSLEFRLQDKERDSK